MILDLKVFFKGLRPLLLACGCTHFFLGIVIFLFNNARRLKQELSEDISLVRAAFGVTITASSVLFILGFERLYGIEKYPLVVWGGSFLGF